MMTTVETTTVTMTIGLHTILLVMVIFWPAMGMQQNLAFATQMGRDAAAMRKTKTQL